MSSKFRQKFHKNNEAAHAEKKTHAYRKDNLATLKEFYLKEYKKLFLVPLVLFSLAMLIIAATYFSTGDFFRRDVTLKGGISLTITTDYNLAELEGFLNQRFPHASLNMRTIESGGKISAIIIEASDITENELLSAAREKANFKDYSVETMGSSLGESFFRQMFIALMLAFLFMGLVFHFYFRNIYATSAALVSAFFDIAITAGIMDLLGVRLTAGGIAAYLMLIGYSIDTSILLSTKLLKGTQDFSIGVFKAMKTGLTMSVAGIAATGISFLLTNNSTLKQIMLILIVGLFIDIITTWIGNFAFLRYYMEKKNVKA